MSDTQNTSVLALIFPSHDAVFTSTTQAKKPMAACKHILSRAISDIKLGTRSKRPLYEFIRNTPGCATDADFVVHTIQDNSSDGKQMHNELRHRLLDDGWNVLSCFDKDATPVVR